MPHHHAHQVHPDGVAQDHREAEQHPRQERRQEVQHTEEVHANVRIAARPHVHQHNGERLPEKQQIDEERENGHQNAAVQEHHDKVGAAATERALLQHATVAVREDHVEQERETGAAEEHERGGQPPQLVVVEDQRRIEVQLER